MLSAIRRHICRFTFRQGSCWRTLPSSLGTKCLGSIFSARGLPPQRGSSCERKSSYWHGRERMVVSHLLPDHIQGRTRWLIQKTVTMHRSEEHSSTTILKVHPR